MDPWRLTRFDPAWARPVLRSSLRSASGESGLPVFSTAACWTRAAAPATMGVAELVPPKFAVYALFGSPPSMAWSP